MKKQVPEIVILGVDPGTTVTGYGVLKLSSKQFILMDYGCVRPPAKLKITDRYLILFEALSCLLEKFNPDAVAIETQYVKKNVQSAIKLGMARGVAIVAAKRKGASVHEYAPSKAKLAVTGRGNASKQQVQAWIKRLFNLTLSAPEDAADALALAICHGHAVQTSMAFGMEI